MKDLPTNRLNLHIYDEIDSTNDEAKRIEGIKDFHIFIAENKQKEEEDMVKSGLALTLATYT